MIKYNIWYKAKGQYAQKENDFFYNYFFKPHNNKISYYSIVIHHPEFGEYFTMVENKDYDYCLENIIEKFSFFEVNEQQIIRNCFDEV